MLVEVFLSPHFDLPSIEVHMSDDSALCAFFDVRNSIPKLVFLLAVENATTVVLLRFSQQGDQFTLFATATPVHTQLFQCGFELAHTELLCAIFAEISI